VEFFEHGQAAEQAGYRPCKRCQPHLASPQDPYRELIAHACRWIESASEPPTLEQLAAAAGLSPYHFHRVFKSSLGITPKQYALTHRQQRLRIELKQQESVTQAIYEAGFGSSSRVYEKGSDPLGMDPSQYRQGGQGVIIHHTLAETYLGQVVIAFSQKGVCAIEFVDELQCPETLLRQHFPQAELRSAGDDFADQVQAVINHITAPEKGLDLPLDIQGTAFQQRVWSALKQVEPGTTITYTQLAAQIGQPRGARAVAQACAANPLAVVIPCHRVVRKGGGISGYRWGVDRKRALLQQEGSLHTPVKSESAIPSSRIPHQE
jgi:AraC family transcriptional regulator of adaptative response/methylated-DNA-[protein]-cysteine methyltransferase